MSVAYLTDDAWRRQNVREAQRIYRRRVALVALGVLLACGLFALGLLTGPVGSVR